MEKKLLNELSADELNELYTQNNWLREECAHYRDDSVSCLRDEILHHFRGIRSVDYCIDDCGYSFMRVKDTCDYSAFLSACRDIQHDYCVFDTAAEKLLGRLSAKINLYRDAYGCYVEMSDRRYAQLEGWIESGLETICSALEEYLLALNVAAEEYLEDFMMNCGEDYETDGTFIYELEVRKHA